MGHAFGSIDELGEGYGFRKVRKPLGVTAFGVNAIVYPPCYEGFHHFHDPRTSSTSSTRARRAWRSTARSGRSARDA